MSLAEPMFQRLATPSNRDLLVGLVVLALILAFPFIYPRFPTYASGYLIQIPAVGIGYWYFQRFRIFSLYTDRRCRGLLLLSFIIPLQNTFWLKAFRKFFLDSNLLLELLRPEILLFIAVAIGAALAPRNKEAYARIPGILKLSFFLGLAAWVISTAASANPLLSFSTGIFEFIIPFVSLYVFAAVAPDRTFMKHAIALFIISYALVSVALISATLININSMSMEAPQPVLGLPLFAIDFLNIKRDIKFTALIGGNAYENPDFFISLWVMIVPFLVVFYYASSRKWAVLLALLIIFYAGFFEYSRAGIVVVMIALLFVIGLRLFLFRHWSWLPALLVLFVGLIHIDETVGGYFSNGLSEFLAPQYAKQSLPIERQAKSGTEKPSEDQQALPIKRQAKSDTEKQIVDQQAARKANEQAELRDKPLDTEVDKSQGDYSGSLRSLAWKKSITVGMQNFWTGIGYGSYPTYIDATPPHSLLLYRFAEGGILGLASILMLAVYAPWWIVVSLHRRDKDMFLYATTLGLSCFMLKALPFSSSFALVGIIVWGFGFAMMLASIIVPLEGAEIVPLEGAVSLGKLVAPTFAVAGSATRLMTLLWSSTDLAARKVGRSAARVPLVIWAATVVAAVLIFAATSSVREYAKRIDSTANAVAQYEKRMDAEFATIGAALREAAANRQQLESQITALREAAANRQQLESQITALREAAASRQQLESLIQANAQLVRQIADLKGQIDALKHAHAAPRAAPGRLKRRR